MEDPGRIMETEMAEAMKDQMIADQQDLIERQAKLIQEYQKRHKAGEEIITHLKRKESQARADLRMTATAVFRHWTFWLLPSYVKEWIRADVRR